MKRITLIAIFLMAFVLVLSGCEQKVKDKETSTNKLIGFWHVGGSKLSIPEEWYFDVEEAR